MIYKPNINITSMRFKMPQQISEWGSSDQNIMNKSIHNDLKKPKKMPSPFDDKLRSAAEDAVDFYWDEWPEYKTNREGLIDNAVHSYLRSYHRDSYENLRKMFASKEISESQVINEAATQYGPSAYVNTSMSSIYIFYEEFVMGSSVEFDYVKKTIPKFAKTAKDWATKAQKALDKEFGAKPLMTGYEPVTGPLIGGARERTDTAVMYFMRHGIILNDDKDIYNIEKIHKVLEKVGIPKANMYS